VQHEEESVTRDIGNPYQQADKELQSQHVGWQCRVCCVDRCTGCCNCISEYCEDKSVFGPHHT